jgi:hypothetical protein
MLDFLKARKFLHDCYLGAKRFEKKVKKMVQVIKYSFDKDNCRCMAYSEIILQFINIQLKAEQAKSPKKGKPKQTDQALKLQKLIRNIPILARAMLNIFRHLSKISVASQMLKNKGKNESISEYIKNLRLKYDYLVDLLMDDKKIKEEMMQKAIGGNKGGFRNKIYYFNYVYSAIIKKALLKDSVQKIETFFADDDESW